MMMPHKNPNSTCSRSFQASEYVMYLEGDAPQLHKDRSTWTQNLQTSLLYLNLVVHLYPLWYPLSYTKLVNIGDCFPEFCELF